MRRGRPQLNSIATLCFSFFLLFFCATSSFSQAKISGIVMGADSVPLEGVTIIIKNSNTHTISAADGSFSISARPGDFLIFSYIGMAKKIFQLHDEQSLRVTMTYNIQSLSDIAVIGYGRLARKDVTGAVDKLSEPDFNKGIITDPIQQLQGKVAGLVIIKPGGDPNGEFTVRLRGATSIEGQPPLLVIDGIAIDDFYRAAASLNPSDVESYDILKDAAAAAVYGARGANGVIIVTTKKGRAGKMLVEYNGFVALENIAKGLDILDAGLWRQAADTLNGNAFDYGGNEDWQKTISQTGFTQSHFISISGGGNNLNVRGSVGYSNQQGTIINTGKEVITARIRAIQKSLNNKLEVSYGINASVINREFLPDQTSPSQSRTTSGSEFFGLVSKYLPVWPAYKDDGSYFIAPTLTPNPLYVVRNIYSKQKENFFQGSVKADYEIITGLKFGVLGAISRGNNINDRFVPPIPGTNDVPVASKDNFNSQIFSGDIHGNYRKNFGKHAIDFTGVYEYNKYLNDGFGVRASGFLVGDLLNNNLGAASSITPNDIYSGKNEVKLISFLGRLIYNYDDRYIVTGNLRRDGSSKFGPNNRWGTFPSIAAAWNIANEKFLASITWIDNLKLRVSYGLTGNQENLPPNNYQILYGPAGLFLYNNQYYQSYAITQENNPNLKWEVRKSFNVGIDFSFFKDRLRGSVDVFNDHTDDMLFKYGIPVPPFLSDSVFANAASAVNKGFEITLGSSIIKNKNFSWDIQANFSKVRNHITNLLGEFKGFDLTLNDPAYGFASGGGFGFAPVTFLKLGYPAGVFWLPQHAGFDATGNELFNNYDGNGKLIGVSPGFSDQDKVFTDPTPSFSWGFTSNFRLKNFDLSFFLRGIQGQKIFANSLLNLGSRKYLPGENVTKDALTNGFKERPLFSDYWLRDGSFCRLDNITIGYNFKATRSISNLRVYLTATNLFVITSYDGVDPEIVSEGRQRYIDQGYYPKSRGFLVGVKLGL